MDRWEGKTAIVTGASSGIGSIIVKDLVKHGVNVVAMARRLDYLQKLKDEMSNCRGNIYPLKVDLSEEMEIIEAFNWISNKLGPIHILINNAALNIMSDTTDVIIDDWRNMFNVNVFAAGICIREYLKSVKTHNPEDGRIINLSSIVAHKFIHVPGFYIYTATKYALKSLTLGMRRELIAKHPNIIISTVSPGHVRQTELFKQQDSYDPEYAKTRETLHPSIHSNDVSNTVLHILSQPPGVMIEDVIIQSSHSLT